MAGRVARGGSLSFANETSIQGREIRIPVLCPPPKKNFLMGSKSLVRMNDFACFSRKIVWTKGAEKH